MSVPHADRDHSEQPEPTQPEAFVELLPPDVGHNLRHLGPERAHVTGEECHCSPERIPHPTQGTSRSVSAREVRASEAQVEAALDVIAETLGWRSLSRATLARRVADAVVAAGPDADEVARLRAEVERWTEKAQEAGAAYANANSKHHAELDRANRLERLADTLAEKAVDLEDRARAAEAERDEIAGRLSALLCELTGGRLSKTTYDVRTMVAEIDSAYDDAQREERAERDRLAEVVARVEDLAETMANEHGQSWNSITARRIRIHLSGPTPAQTPQNGPEPALSREQGTPGQSGEGEALRGAEKGEEAGR